MNHAMKDSRCVCGNNLVNKDLYLFQVDMSPVDDIIKLEF